MESSTNCDSWWVAIVMWSVTPCDLLVEEIGPMMRPGNGLYREVFWWKYVLWTFANKIGLVAKKATLSIFNNPRWRLPPSWIYDVSLVDLGLNLEIYCAQYLMPALWWPLDREYITRFLRNCHVPRACHARAKSNSRSWSQRTSEQRERVQN